MILKGRGEGRVPFIAPEFEKLAWQYQKAWNINSMDLLKCYGVIQKFTDQAISSDSYVDFDQYVDRKKPMKEILQEFLFAAKIGMKTRYYSNSKTLSEDEGGDECESCKL